MTRRQWRALREYQQLAVIDAWCPVCLVPCDPEIHAATVRVRGCFREFVTPAVTPPQKDGKLPALWLGQIERRRATKAKNAEVAAQGVPADA